MKWRRVVSEQSRIGQSVKAFCSEHGLCRPYFFVWKKRLEEDTPTKSLEVQVAGPGPSTPGDSSVEIRLRNGRSLMVRPGFDAEHVRALLAVVEAAG
jgi:transposase-like protein